MRIRPSAMDQIRDAIIVTEECFLLDRSFEGGRPFSVLEKMEGVSVYPHREAIRPDVRPDVRPMVGPHEGNRVLEEANSAEVSPVVGDRFRTCRSAGAVFSEFAMDAAMEKVQEALHGRTSEARQRAQETILAYALGTPIKRSMSLSFNTSDLSDEELRHDIRRLLVDLGFQKSERAASQILIGIKGAEGEK